MASVFEVTTKDIDKFATEYVGSAEERADVLKFYVEGNGYLPLKNFSMFSTTFPTRIPTAK